MRILSNIYRANKFAHSDCSCNESDACNTLQSDSNRGVPFTICPWLYTIQSYLESGKTVSGISLENMQVFECCLYIFNATIQ